MELSKLEVNISFNFKLDITEEEARALNELSRFGLYDSVAQIIHEKYSTNLTTEHEKGLKSFFNNIQKNISPKISEINDIKKLIIKTTKKN